MAEIIIQDQELEAVLEARGLWQDALRRLARNRAAIGGIVVLTIIAFVTLLAPLLSPHPFDAIDWDHIGTPPDLAAHYFFGTDANGRDLFVRTLYGGRLLLPLGAVPSTGMPHVRFPLGAISRYCAG